jgi:hypothetical protein
MNTSFFLKVNLPLTVVIFLSASFWQAGSGRSARADEDPLDAIVKAHAASCKSVASATGSGTYELYRQEPSEKEPKLFRRAKVDVQFGEGKYNLHFDYETWLEYGSDKIAPRKLFETKPDNFFAIYTGISRIDVEFRDTIRPSGCKGDINDSETANLWWRELAQVSKRFNPGGYVEKFGREKLTVTQLENGIYRVSCPIPGARYEFDADPKVGFNIVADRVRVAELKEPYQSQEITWKQKNDIWYGDQIVESHLVPKEDKTLSMTTRTVFKYDDFAPDTKIAPAVFTVAATGVRRGAMFHDLRKGAPNRVLYWDGETLTPEKPRK